METTAMEWREHISIDPAVCHGQACIKGTRIPVAIVLDDLAAGLSAEEIVDSYPPLRLDDVRGDRLRCRAGARTLGRDSSPWRGMRLEVDRNLPREACDVPSRAGPPDFVNFCNFRLKGGK
jgi:uncharacterized protein (DUF433 family)